MYKIKVETFCGNQNRLLTYDYEIYTVSGRNCVLVKEGNTYRKHYCAIEMQQYAHI